MTGPYALAALDYLDAGWFPLPLGGPKGKTPLVSGRHGDNPLPTRAEVEDWMERYPDANIGLRLPEGVVGIDVDCYDAKPGARTVAEREAEWGALPPAWISTARSDGSGIRLFAVPAGLDWPGKLGPGVEIIHCRNRFVAAAPSIHHTGKRYRWLSPEGGVFEGIPEVGDIHAAT